MHYKNEKKSTWNKGKACSTPETNGHLNILNNKDVTVISVCLSVFFVCEKNTCCLCLYECCRHSCRMVSLVTDLEAAVSTLQIIGAYGTEQRVIPEGGWHSEIFYFIRKQNIVFLSAMLYIFPSFSAYFIEGREISCRWWLSYFKSIWVIWFWVCLTAGV